MSQVKTQIGEIAYNPAEEAFEALVGFHTTSGPAWVAARFRAPLTAEFNAVSSGLLDAALKALGRRGALQSRILTRDAAPVHSGLTLEAPLRAA